MTAHPDDFMTVTVTLSFNAKAALDRPVDVVATETSYCMPAGDEAFRYLSDIMTAIQHKRLFGFMQQDAAESAVESGEWVAK